MSGPEPGCVLVTGPGARLCGRVRRLLTEQGIAVIRADAPEQLAAAVAQGPLLAVVCDGSGRGQRAAGLEPWLEPLLERELAVVLLRPQARLLEQPELLASPLVEVLPGSALGEPLLARVRALDLRQRRVQAGREQSRELDAMLEISKAFNSTLDSGTILYFIARKLGEAMELQRCSFIVPDVELGIGRVIACKDDPNIHSLEINIDNYPEIKQVLRTGERVLITDVEGDPIMAEVKRFADVFRDQSIMTLPLKLHEHIIGVLQIRKKSRGRGFSDQELEYAELLANQAASALRNARLYEDRERQNAELRRQKAELESLSQQLRRKNDELLELTQLKEDFTTMIVHDLRSPLMIVQGVLDLLLMKLASDSPDRELVQDGINVTKKMLRLINNLLEVSRLESGELELRLEPVELDGLIEETVEPLRVLADSRSISLRTSVADGVPPIQADRGRLIQVLDNLLTNALKFTQDEGSVRVDAYLEGSGDDARVRIDVIDTGVGIAREDLPEIFKRFRQGRHGGRKKGTGLGLNIVQLMVHAHDGEVAVESEQGKGSRFSIKLPVVRSGRPLSLGR